MNRTVPTANLSETAAEKDKRRRRTSKLRPIDKGTYYDVPGKLRGLLHEIESGALGEVTDAVIAIRRVEGQNSYIKTIHVGKGNGHTRHYMACRLVQEYYEP